MSYNSLEELEEGEILEEIPSVSQKGVEEKVLPRRYILHENKNVHYKHKKTCRHAVHYYAQKLAKLKKKAKESQKHRKSRCHRSLGKPSNPARRDESPVKENTVNSNLNTKNEAYFNSHSLYVEMKNNFKNHIKSPRKIPVPKKSNSEKSLATSVSSKSLNNFNLKLLSQRCQQQNVMKNHPKIKGDITYSSRNEILLKNCHIEKEANENVFSSVRKEVYEESEDEEELRRIALATCAKRTIINKSMADESNEVKALLSNSVSLSLAVQDKAVTSQSTVGDIQAIDNYEVVDMEVDEEEIVSDDQLFTIDKNPSPMLFEGFEDIKSGMISGGQSPKNQSIVSSHIDDDFEEVILRAELINNMVYPKKFTTVKDQVIKNVPMEINARVKRVCPPQNNFYKSTKAIRKKPIFVKKPVKNVPTGKTAMVKPHERVIINVGETSTDESDQDDLNQEEINKENAAASIEALISNARQKSDENKTSNKVNNIPDAVSCLSKAQQEEYNSLMKLLAQRSVVSAELKKPATHSPTEDLKLLEKKFAIAEENLRKEKLVLIDMQKEFLEQKNVYIKSRLTVQYLKEQLVAADRIRKSHFKNSRTLASRLEIIKNNVKKREAVVNELKSECTKLGFSIRGQNYTLPPLSNNLPPQINPTS